ncbi:MFS transporter [Lacticaseibacillus paracasei]|uniref:MFS transporter n=1 Tax=Lacticaseibacillus paracasei TaxID=1597 RepID=UPI002F260580
MSHKNLGWQAQTAAFLLSQNLFVFGSSTVFYAVLWDIALKTSSGAWMTYVSLATALPAILISLTAGVLADRYNRKMLIVLSAAVVTLLTLLVASIFAFMTQDLWLLLVIAVIRSFGNGLENPAANALLPQLVPAKHLTRVNGYNQILMAAMLVMSPLLAGYILSDLGIFWIFVVDALSAALAILFLSVVHVRTPSASHDRAAKRADGILAGLQYVKRTPILLAFMLFTGLAFILVAPSSQLSTLYVNRTFGSEVWHLTFNEWFWTIGAGLGGLYIARHKHFRDQLGLIAIAFAGSGLAFAEMGLPQSFSFYLLFMFVSGIFYPLIQAGQTIYLQENVPADKLGRVFSLWAILSTGIYPLAMLVYGPLADQVSIGRIFVVTGLLLIGVAYWFWHRLRKLSW